MVTCYQKKKIKHVFIMLLTPIIFIVTSICKLFIVKLVIVLFPSIGNGNHLGSKCNDNKFNNFLTPTEVVGCD
jgi:hypothetical protein